MNNHGYIVTLQAFLEAHFPGLKLYHDYNSDSYTCWLPENPASATADRAVDEAWERNRG